MRLQMERKTTESAAFCEVGSRKALKFGESGETLTSYPRPRGRMKTTMLESTIPVWYHHTTIQH